MAYKGYKSLAIIPARGGSKGIPGKNIKDLAGKPLIAWTIEAAKNSEYIDRVIVSTDDESIIEVAKKFGAEVPFIRPKEISGDLATDIEFINHALQYLAINEKYQPDIVLRLPPTSPLRTSSHIDAGIKTLVETAGADAVRPIVPVPKHPYKFWIINKENSTLLKPFLEKEITGFDEPHNLPRQLLPDVYMHTGAMDVIWYRTIVEQQSTSGRSTAYFFMDEDSACNIDHPNDFLMSEILMKKRINGESIQN